MNSFYPNDGHPLHPSPQSYTGRRARIAALCILVILNGILLAAAGWKTGSNLPDLRKAGLDGGTAERLAGKVVLLDFWASWCSPCKASFPALDSLQKKFSDKEFVILAINEDENPATMQAFLKEHPVNFTTVHDPGHKLVELAAVDSMPTSFLIDTNGKIRFVHKGFHGEKTTALYEREIEMLLQEIRQP